MFDSKFDKLIYSAPEETLTGTENFGAKLRHICPDIQIISEFPNFRGLGLLDDPKSKSLVIIDDQLEDSYGSKTLMTVVTRISHHMNISCIVDSQNLYFQSKNSTTINRNFSERIVFFARANRQVAEVLGRQISKKHSSCIEDAFDWINSNLKHQQLKVG